MISLGEVPKVEEQRRKIKGSKWLNQIYLEKMAGQNGEKVPYQLA